MAKQSSIKTPAMEYGRDGETPPAISNRRASRIPYPDEQKKIKDIERTEEERKWLSSWRLLNHSATPLWSLPKLAATLGIAQLRVKDESKRSPLASFKALGAPIALIRLILRLYPERSFEPAAILAGRYQDDLRALTVITATDGNHGRALAAAAQSSGCRCVIVLHARVSTEREQAIAAFGAEIVRVAGNYDASVKEAARLAATNGWHVVSDTSYSGYEDVPGDIMRGYGIISQEIIEQISDPAGQPFTFTHIFLQGGVGALPAGVLDYLWKFYGPRRPTSVIVEPRQADCLYQSAHLDRAAHASGAIDSIMAGLACGEASPLAWQVLRVSADYFMTVEDSDATTAMRQLAAGNGQDVPIVAGASGAAGLAGLQVACGNQPLRAMFGLNEHSHVLVINTEGDTAPSIYQTLVGESGQSVLARQSSRQSGHRPSDQACLPMAHG
ncbi:diaminopropionate ammonia-lyase [Paralcaligenes ureilyticus]|uniref:Diaminopropionate ammonia-lyase n=2 Tax=Paralcaligenes ureilyticus TaxID=627131 RepID=A0A4V2UX84_9BURK|nr:diaminopropionate ammonia-lyase [Paralcaligenes ureilyticus]